MLRKSKTVSGAGAGAGAGAKPGGITARKPPASLRGCRFAEVASRETW